MTPSPLGKLRVADLSSGVAGAYCTKLLVDAGAEVIKIEDPAGDQLRAWSATSGRVDGRDGALFRYLAGAKQSVVTDPAAPEGLMRALRVVASCDAVVWSEGSTLTAQASLAPSALRDRFPALIVVAVTPFGLTGPWSGRPANEFTLQAWAGAIGWRGLPGAPPVSVGGRVGEWVAGVYAANGLLAAWRRSQRCGHGEVLDVAVLDAIALSLTNMHPVSYFAEAGVPRDPHPTSLLPGIHPTSDGWVGFMTGTGQQWLDFCVLVEQFDWLDDFSLIRAAAREARRAELTAHIDGWTSVRSTDEVVQLASKLRVPVAPMGTGATIPEVDHFVDQQMFQPSADGSFMQPTRPYRLARGLPAPAAVAPALGEHSELWSGCLPREPFVTEASLTEAGTASLPFSDLRIVELAAFWAGPSAAHFFAMLGAEVIKVESPARPDGMRTITTRDLDETDWWEHAPLYHAVNTGKLSLGLRLDRADGRAVLVRLLERSDVLIENFSPRVLESWGLDWDAVHDINPRLVLVRMPAFGLAGPWRDRTGFAQTMEQASGMAWLTGYPDSSPLVPSGVCDPLAGAHAAFALQVALAERERTGQGTLVEVPMVHSALNIAAEQVVEYSAYGRLLARVGNRGPEATPQNVYRALGTDDGTGGPYVALAIADDDQWQRLVAALGTPSWADDPNLASELGRRADQDAVDEYLRQWFAQQHVDEAVDLLWSAGIPVARVTMPHLPARAQLDARAFFETVEHPVAGPGLIAGLPVRFSAGPAQVHHSPAPLLGEHNHDVLSRVIGLSAIEIAQLQADGTVGFGLHVDD